MNNKKIALTKALGCMISEITEKNKNTFIIDNKKYVVLNLDEYNSGNIIKTNNVWKYEVDVKNNKYFVFEI